MQRIKAWAKVNLALCIGPRRPDGYHDLCTVFHRVALADEITLAKDERTQLVVVDEVGGDVGAAGGGMASGRGAGEVAAGGRAAASGAAPGLAVGGAAGLSVGPDNLAWRALALLEEVAGRPLPTRITLRKRIPLQAGLGGGSSDAAAVLTGGNALWGLNLSRETLHVLAHRLGADVPFFVAAQAGAAAALAEGVGEQLTRLPGARGPLLLVRPPFGLGTAEVYQQLDAMRPAVAKEWREPVLRWAEALRTAAALPEAGHNDLQPAALRLAPALAEVFAWLDARGARTALLSGSGSALWALPPVGEAGWCEAAAQAARARGWWACATALDDEL